jgi:threonylcarbamoyladenosine tRNA methylthiotransferase MtaB
MKQFSDLYEKSKENNNSFVIQTLGCRTNSYESKVYESQLKQLGWSKHTKDHKKHADLVIINTCTVTHSADSSSYRAIRRLRKENPNAKIVVTGCLVENMTKTKEELGVDVIVPNLNKENLLHIVYPDFKDIPSFDLATPTSNTRSFIKIQDGCNSFCRYCIIPYVRGRSRSRNHNDIIDEVKGQVACGYREVVLTGINIGDYDGNRSKGYFSKHPLSVLIDDLDQVSGLERLRMSSIDPDDVDHDIIDSICNGEKTSHWMHLVLQSGSNTILNEMGRQYTRESFLDLCRYFIENAQFANLSTDVIVGYPGETDDDFEQTLNIFEQQLFSSIHIFPFSSRPRTKANTLDNKVTDKQIHIRKQQLHKVAASSTRQVHEFYTGKKVDVLIESVTQESARGYTQHYLPVTLSFVSPPESNTIRSVRVVSAEDRLIGVLDE